MSIHVLILESNSTVSSTSKGTIELLFFLKMGQSRPLSVYFRLFYMTQIKYNLLKAWMVCLGLEPGAAEWKA